MVDNNAVSSVDALGEVVATKESETYRAAVKKALERFTGSKLRWEKTEKVKKSIVKELGAGDWFILCIDTPGAGKWWADLEPGINDSIFRYLTRIDRNTNKEIVGNAAGDNYGSKAKARRIDLSMNAQIMEYVAPAEGVDSAGVRWDYARQEFDVTLWHELVAHSIKGFDHPRKKANAFIEVDFKKFKRIRDKLKKGRKVGYIYGWIKNVNAGQGIDPTINYMNGFRSAHGYRIRRPQYWDYVLPNNNFAKDYYGQATEGLPAPHNISFEVLHAHSK